jgi:hypothetical protein
VQPQRGGVGAAGGQRGGQRRRRVDDEHVARAQVLGQVARLRVGEPVLGGDEHPHLVAAQAARLRRLVRLAPCGRRARRRGRCHAPTAAASSDAR